MEEFKFLKDELDHSPIGIIRKIAALAISYYITYVTDTQEIIKKGKFLIMNKFVVINSKKFIYKCNINDLKYAFEKIHLEKLQGDNDENLTIFYYFDLKK